MLSVISRAEAKLQGLPRFYTGHPCKHGHDVERFTASGACIVCARNSQRKWDSKNPDKLKQYANSYGSAHRECRLEAARNYRKLKPANANAATRKWRQKNKDAVRAHCSRYRASRLRASPEWIDLKAIQTAYEEASKITLATGVEHHVDHIVPLKHSLVCGLHVPWNLQVLPATDNRRKKNTFEVA